MKLEAEEVGSIHDGVSARARESRHLLLRRLLLIFITAARCALPV